MGVIVFIFGYYFHLLLQMEQATEEEVLEAF